LQLVSRVITVEHARTLSIEFTVLSQPKPERFQVTDILRRDRWHAQLDQQGYNDERMAVISTVMNALTACRTGYLGSHLYNCQSCDRRLIGLDHCANRHCPTCGYERREQWRESMIDWTLDCEYLHVVFTLPHSLNPLIYVNSKLMYQVLCRTAIQLLSSICKKQFDCTPGMVLILHTWGQKMNLHAHVHLIMTAGGVSSDKTKWINIDSSHPAMQNDALADQFRAAFLGRLKSLVRSNKLIWPTADLLPTNHEALGLDSFEQMVEFVDPAFTKTPLSPGKSRRVLTTTEKALFNKLSSRQWIANCQPTPPEYDGPERVINYLSNYVQGIVISDARIIDDDGQFVTIRYKDYKAGDVKTFKLERGEFVRRFAMHIQPRGSKRLRYAGIFTARGREACLALCSKLIAEAQLDKVAVGIPTMALAPSVSDEHDPGSDDFEESTEPQQVTCYCRVCKSDLELLGRLKGTETHAMQNLSQNIVFRMLSFFTEVAEVGVSQLLSQLRIAWLRPKQLPQPIRDLFIGRARLTFIECAALEALVTEELEKRNITSGIPPPMQQRPSVQRELHHVA